MSSHGWIKLHRKITSCLFWMDKPFDKARAWIDLLLMANHEGNKFLLGNEVVEVERGSFVTSKKKLCSKWGWSNSKVDAFLRLLESEKMLVQKSDTKKTAITIVNWDLYQGTDDTETTPKRIKNESKTNQKRTNNNDKNDKNEKKKDLYAAHVALTQDEHQKLVDSLGQQKTKDMIERLNLYKGSTGKKYASDYMTILNWLRKDTEGGQANGSVSGNSSYYDAERAKWDNYDPASEYWTDETEDDR